MYASLASLPGDSGFYHRTDTGFYGAGVYFSEYPGYSMGYIKGSKKLLLCQVLQGKVGIYAAILCFLFIRFECFSKTLGAFHANNLQAPA